MLAPWLLDRVRRWLPCLILVLLLLLTTMNDWHASVPEAEAEYEFETPHQALVDAIAPFLRLVTSATVPQSHHEQDDNDPEERVHRAAAHAAPSPADGADAAAAASRDWYGLVVLVESLDHADCLVLAMNFSHSTSSSTAAPIISVSLEQQLLSIQHGLHTLELKVSRLLPHTR